jgi:hypothetical protein
MGEQGFFFNQLMWFVVSMHTKQQAHDLVVHATQECDF